jgi:RNA polymerase sigma-70 factor (ECF subfamily)
MTTASLPCTRPTLLELDRAYRPELMRAARRMTRTNHDAEDLVQETMERALAALDRFEPGTNARAWLHRIMRNAFVSRVRRHNVERRILQTLSLDEREPTDVTSNARVFGDKLIRIVDEMPAPYREALLLVGLDDQSYQDAATELGCPVGTVMSRIHRGRKWAQAQLAEEAAA